MAIYLPMTASASTVSTGTASTGSVMPELHRPARAAQRHQSGPVKMTGWPSTAQADQGARPASGDRGVTGIDSSNPFFTRLGPPSCSPPV